MATYSNTAREVEMPNGDVVVIHNAPTGGENTTSNIKKFKYDDNGHVTESTAADAEDLNLSSYSTPTTGTTAIGTSDDIQTAIGKLDHQSQIDQSNILYVADSIGKNLFCPTVDSASSKGFTATRNTDNSYTVSGTRVGAADSVWIAIGEVSLPSGDYILSGAGGADSQLAISVDGTVHYDSGSGEEINAAIKNTLYIHIPSSYNTINAVVYPMICTEEAWNISHTYEPYALPNYDLTRLEAEDRASLAEVVDSGAKNIAEIYNVSQNAITITTSGYKATFSGSASQDGSITWGKIHADKTGDYILYYNMSTSAGRFTVYNQTDSEILGSYYPTDNLTPIALRLVAGKNYTVYSWFAAGTASACVIDLMICTKAAFGVSKAFVPYRPNYDLVCSELKTLEGMIPSTTIVSNGSLNDVSVNTFAIYKSAVSNRPISTDGWFYVKTTVFDVVAGHKIQEATALSDGTSYIRVQFEGTWQSWKQTTNA